MHSINQEVASELNSTIISIKRRAEGDRDRENFQLAHRVHQFFSLQVDAWLRGCSSETGGWMESNGGVGQII